MPYRKRSKDEIRQKETEVLDFCRQYIEENGFSPSYREIGDGLDISSTSMVKEYMDRLRTRGEIIGLSSSPRAFRLKDSRGPKEFVIDDIPDGTEKTVRSIQIQSDINERLKALEKAKRQYTKSAIINKLFDEALKQYGY